jgi:hypothetical protein
MKIQHTINFSQKSHHFSQKAHHFSLLSPTSPCELSEREVTSPSNLKGVRALGYMIVVFTFSDVIIACHS